jgi:hypothetical protein
MLDSIYLGTKTRLIIDHDNDQIKGIRTSAVSPTHVGLRLPDKKPHASSKNPKIVMKAADIFTSIQSQG